MEFLARTAAVRRDPKKMLPDARGALVAVAPYGGDSGPIARYARYFDYHTDLHRRMKTVASELEAILPGVKTLICVDTKPVMERALAAAAGVGSIGKNGCLIVPGLGSYVVLACLLVTAEVGDCEPAPIPDVAHRARWTACGTCRACLDQCPTNAFVGPGQLDARRCVAYLTIEHRSPIENDLAASMGERIAGCDVCQEVCPHNASDLRDQRADPDAWLQPPPRGLRAVDYSRLVRIGSSQYRSFVRDTPLSRIPRRSLRRNALLALGNARRGLSLEERSAVDAGCEDEDPQIQAAALRVRNRS